MRCYHDVAGRSAENTVAFKFNAEGQRSSFFLLDSYCDNPACPGWEIAVSLIALEPVKRTIAFNVNFHKERMTEVGELTPDDRAIAREFCDSKAAVYLLMRRRQLVRAAGLAEQTGRLGPKRQFTGDCYTFTDFDKHREPYPIRFEIGADTWSVLDQYCVVPPCSCEDAVLSFYHHEPGQTRASPSFAVRLDLASGNLFRADHGPLAPEHRRIVDAFLAGFPGWRHELGLRRSFIRRIAARRVEFPEPRFVQPPIAPPPTVDPTRPIKPEPAVAPVPVTAAPGPSKVGRNDPCPCGSGKKFKKCCLAKADA